MTMLFEPFSRRWTFVGSTPGLKPSDNLLMWYKSTSFDVSQRAGIGSGFRFRTHFEQITFDVHIDILARTFSYFHRPVSIQRSIRRIGSSHSHATPAAT